MFLEMSRIICSYLLLAQEIYTKWLIATIKIPCYS
jgi:hypothetical protein